MFAQRWLTGFKRPFDIAQGKEKRINAKKPDTVVEQVRQVLRASDQKLILMVRS